ncbi:MAG: hypothetical protein MIO93_15695 [ANME-2 cluster archaeon]|jgi:predicted RNA-binding Zn-ribbon protein involved in translation (DUF1610 family)|nr:hypothetical protein [ANME-2 cluster archaeon]
MNGSEIPDDFIELEKKMEEASHNRAITVLTCPDCGSTNVTYYMGLKTGVQYQCKDCDYVGTFIIEQDKE